MPHSSLYFLRLTNLFLVLFLCFECWLLNAHLARALAPFIVLLLGFPMPPIHSFGALGTKTNVIFEILVAGPFLFHSLFPLLRFGSQKPLADFPLMGDLV